MKIHNKNKIAYILTAAIVLQGFIPNMQAAAGSTSVQTGEAAAISASNYAVTTVPNSTVVAATTPIATAPVADVPVATMSSPMRITMEDIWDDWSGKIDFQGDGSEESPYLIASLSHLMGLSQAVAQGESYEGTYFEMTRDLDLSGIRVNSGNWNPIGWYQDADEMDGEVRHPFKGIFDGHGHTIKGLNIIEDETPLGEIGLFGVIDGGTVKNLTVEAGNIIGTGNAAVLAGTVCGDSLIYNVIVSGYVSSKTGNAGGLAAIADGKGERVTIENCTAGSIAVYSAAADSGSGGIAGLVSDCDLVDSVVETQNGTSDRIRGTGYVGGVAGVMENANIFNSYVNGTVGGNGSRAAGGIIGKYMSGNLILARFAGTVASTGMGVSAREGTFVGTRDSGHGFTYGTSAGDNMAYLFANTASKAKNAIGSDFDEDNTFTKSAHIGYWMDNQRTYSLVSGNTEVKDYDRYFYEELEDGVRFIITGKLSNEFTADGAAAGQIFRLDHFAPGMQGQPVRGYLLSVPRIDAKNANGTYDADVASLTAMPEGNQSYYRAIDKNHAAAVAPGTTVTVVTAPNNSDGNRYQMAADSWEAGRVKAPTYINDLGMQVPMSYVSGGTYTFKMPNRDTQINAEYVKVTTILNMTPDETVISVTQTRTGDRKNPDIVTEVHDENGALIARYIDETPDTSVQAQPVRIHSEHNQAGGVVDQTVVWSVDDKDLLDLVCDTGYTEKDAQIMPNLNGSFVQDILSKQVKAQADGAYLSAINPDLYEKHAVVTAASNPATSADHVAVYGNCKVTVTFQILDYTTRRVEGLQLNQSDILLTVTRTLSGNRLNPTETISCSEPVVLAAALYPEQPFYKNVSWADRESGASIVLTPGGSNASQCAVTVRYDANGLANPAWIQNVINADNQRRKEDPYVQLSGSAVHTETVTATSEDQTHGVVAADCKVTIRFETVDKTTRWNVGSGSGGSSSGRLPGGVVSSSGGASGGPGNTSAGAGNAGSAGTMSGGVIGSWTQTADGKWAFAAGHRYRSEWAYIFNPYADTTNGQSTTDWFYFDEHGYMATGWQWITGADGKTKCYYLNEYSDGTRGAMFHGKTTPDGYQVNEDGAWTVDGIEQLR